MEQSDHPAVNAFEDARDIARVFALDPKGFGGVVVRSRCSELRLDWLEYTRRLCSPLTMVKTVPPNVATDRLLGGLNIAATLAQGRPVGEFGILASADRGLVVLRSANLLPRAILSQIISVCDAGQVNVARDGITLSSSSKFGIVAFDDGDDDDQSLPAALTDRLAFRIGLVRAGGGKAFCDLMEVDDLAGARAMLPNVRCDDQIREALSKAAQSLGITSIRAEYLALRTARALGALDGRDYVSDDDAIRAARLVFSWRAFLHEDLEDQEQMPNEAPEEDLDQSDVDDVDEHVPDELDDIIVDIVQSTITTEMLALSDLKTSRKNDRTSTTGESGGIKKGSLRGRTIGTTARKSGSAQLDILETIKAAIPWQKIRAQDGSGIKLSQKVTLPLAIRESDFRFKKYKSHTGRLVIFVVDASGSSAMNRLAEAKGAVETLLAECYSRRNQVALIAFRGTDAEVLLPATRALARARSCLADLPGGGSTPLSTAMDVAGEMVHSAKQKGVSPFLVFMTDGRPNVTRDKKVDRGVAFENAKEAAQLLKRAASVGVWVDTSPRPDPRVQELADCVGIDYLPLPIAQPELLSASARKFMNAKS